MNAEAFDIVNRVGNRNRLLLTPVTRACIHLPNRQRPSKQVVDCRFDALAGFLGAWAAGGRLQPGVGSIGMERVFGCKNEVAAIRCRKLEAAGHAHGAYLPSAGARCLLAFAAIDRKSTRL